MNKLDGLLDILEEIAFLESNQYKQRAYNIAISVLRSKGEESFQRRTKFSDIPGIGGSIESKILEYKKTGGSSKLIELRTKYPNKLDPKLYKIRKTFITKRITYQEAAVLSESLLEILDIDLSKITIAGSFRRKSKLVGDLDIIISSEDSRDFTKLYSKLTGRGYKIIADGEKKLSFIIDPVNMTSVDIYITKPSHYWYMILYLTGSADFNKMMRAKAKKLGYTLNQYDLIDKKGNKLQVTSEEEIFEKLGMKYTKPENR